MRSFSPGGEQIVFFNCHVPANEQSKRSFRRVFLSGWLQAWHYMNVKGLSNDEGGYQLTVMLPCIDKIDALFI